MLKTLSWFALSALTLVPASAAPTAPGLLHVGQPSGCWVRSPAGFRPRLTLNVTPSEKLETLAITGSFQALGGQPSAPSVHFDAEKNLRLHLQLTTRSARPALPRAPVTTAAVTARVLPYAARNTTTLGQVRAVSLLTFQLPSTVCQD
jgi:hypothetical protein